MTFRNLSLPSRLLLALCPGIAFLAPAAIMQIGLYDTRNYFFLRAAAFGALFGGLVMAPFITSRNRVFLRVCVLMTVAVFCNAAVFLPSYPLDLLPNVWGLYYLIVLAPCLLLALSNAAALAIVAPLKVSPRYWSYAALAAAVLSVVAYIVIDRIAALCGVVECSRKDIWPSDVLPFLWPLLFYAAVYFGTTQELNES